MSKNNGKLPDYLILFSETTGKWHIISVSQSPEGTDPHGNEAFKDVNISHETKLSLLDEASATYQIIDPRQHIKQKGST